MERYVWSRALVPSDEIASRREDAKRMRRRLNQLHNAESEPRLYAHFGRVSRGASLAGLGILAVDLFTTGGAVTALTIGGSVATGIGGAKELIDIVYIPRRTAEKRRILVWRDEVDRYLDRLDSL